MWPRGGVVAVHFTPLAGELASRSETDNAGADNDGLCVERRRHHMYLRDLFSGSLVTH